LSTGASLANREAQQSILMPIVTQGVMEEITGYAPISMTIRC